MTGFVMLASGSEGNAALLTTDHSRVLIDCGLGVRELTRRMQQVGESMDIDAIILTHSHGDHTAGLVPVMRNSMKRGAAVPVYVTRETSEILKWQGMESPPVRHFEAGRPFRINDVCVEPFTVSHDCVDPTNFVFGYDGVRIGFSTDLGFVPPAMIRKFADCQIVVVESNHDLEMLAAGTHPIEVKERVAGPTGHLSNDQAADFIGTLGKSVRTIVLGHLSEDNNTPQLAEWSARRAVLMAGLDVQIVVARQREAVRIL